MKMKPWRQGYLLHTNTVIHMRQETRDYCEFKEKCCIYENFTAIDEGRSRILVAECQSPEIAKHIIEIHNDAVTRDNLANGTNSSKA